MHVWVYVPMHANGRQRRVSSGFSSHSLPYFLKTESFTEPRDRLEANKPQKFTSICPIPMRLQSCVHSHPVFFFFLHEYRTFKLSLSCLCSKHSYSQGISPAHKSMSEAYLIKRKDMSKVGTSIRLDVLEDHCGSQSRTETDLWAEDPARHLTVTRNPAPSNPRKS